MGEGVQQRLLLQPLSTCFLLPPPLPCHSRLLLPTAAGRMTTNTRSHPPPPPLDPSPTFQHHHLRIPLLMTLIIPNHPFPPPTANPCGTTLPHLSPPPPPPPLLKHTTATSRNSSPSRFSSNNPSESHRSESHRSEYHRSESHRSESNRSESPSSAIRSRQPTPTSASEASTATGQATPPPPPPPHWSLLLPHLHLHQVACMSPKVVSSPAYLPLHPRLPAFASLSRDLALPSALQTVPDLRQNSRLRRRVSFVRRTYHRLYINESCSVPLKSPFAPSREGPRRAAPSVSHSTLPISSRRSRVVIAVRLNLYKHRSLMSSFGQPS
mmetsp:Transcript_8021/g.12900  ORF Transcript_8021/g.12900 Transcript_8021/m.12900 type:complete len:325 (-) Transcript_8021:356-1330(-)